MDQTSSIVLVDYGEEHSADGAIVVVGAFSIVAGKSSMMVAFEVSDMSADDMGSECSLFSLAIA